MPLGREAHGVYSLCFGASGAQLAAGFGDGAVQVAGPGGGRSKPGPPLHELTPLSPQLVDAGTGAPGPCLRPGRRPRQAVTALGFHRAKPGLLLAAGADGVVVLYDLRAGSAAASLTGRPAAGGRAGARRAGWMASRTLPPGLLTPSHCPAEEENEIHALDFCRDGSAFATAGKDRHIRLYDSHTHQVSPAPPRPPRPPHACPRLPRSSFASHFSSSTWCAPPTSWPGMNLRPSAAIPGGSSRCASIPASCTFS